jgi:hypothetical protein
MSFSSTVNKSHIDDQYNRLIQEIKDTFGEDSDRTVALLKMYEDYQERVREAPASGKLNFHSAYEGGYLDHVLNVLDTARLVKRLYEHIDGLIDFTDEELVMVALHHDLGKLGLLENEEVGTSDDPYYVVQDSDWHRKNRWEVYKHNDDAQYMTVNDRSVFILQAYGITLTQNEYIAIKLTDGLYDESNKKYLIQYGAGFFPMRTNLPYIMHWADHMSARRESDEVRKKKTR